MIIVDVETTGTDPQKHSLLSIGAIDFNNPDNQFFIECRAFDGAHIDNDALEVNGVSRDDVFDEAKLADEDALRKFIDWLGGVEDHTIGGQNPFFDVGFLMETAKRYHINLSLAHRILDLHSIVYFDMIRRGITPPQKNGRTDLDSDRVMNYVGLQAEPRPHIAINGAKWEAEAFSRLFHNKSLFKEFEGYAIPWNECLQK